MRRIYAVCVLLSWIALAGCTGSQTAGPDGPAKPGGNTPAYERLVVMFEGLSAQLSAAKNDCGRVATLLGDWSERHRTDYPELSAAALADELPAADRPGYESRLKKALGGIVDTASACGNHAGAQAAFTSFDVLVDPK